MQAIIQNNINELNLLFQKHKVKKAFAFGSVCTESFSDKSDIDLLVDIDDSEGPILYGEHYFDLANELETLLNRKVDLLTIKSLKNPYFIKSIDETKVSLYGH
jgi:uncharacterized protein